MMRLNLIPKREYTRASCSWHDTTARKWQFHIYNEKDRWQIDADSVTLECSNGAEVPGTIENNTVVVDCTAEVSATPGHYRAKLRFTKGTAILHTQAFDLWVEDLSYGTD